MPEDAAGRKVRRNRGAQHHKSQLRVVFDTNALYVTPTNIGSASDLVRQEIADLIGKSKYPDLDILWFLPEVVRHERQYQMQTEALKLRSSITKIERLLGHNLALTDQILLDHVETKITEKENMLGLREIKLDHGQVDWPAMIRAASYRRPPFQPGEKEKGFRDALILESFLQLVFDSPKTPSSCRVVLVTADEVLMDAVATRIAGHPNASVLRGIDELEGLINTIVSNLGEDFIAALKPKAEKLFFVKDEQDTLFVKEKIRDRLSTTFKDDLAALPEGASFRNNGTWWISPPNFSKKEGRRIFWTSRITRDAEAGYTVEATPAYTPTLTGLSAFLGGPAGIVPQVDTEFLRSLSAGYSGITQLSAPATLPGLAMARHSPPKKVVTHKGKDVYEVLWSTELTMAKELKKSVIEEIKHIEVTWERIA